MYRPKLYWVPAMPKRAKTGNYTHNAARLQVVLNSVSADTGIETETKVWMLKSLTMLIGAMNTLTLQQKEREGQKA